MHRLRILMGNNTLSLLAGTETWTYTLATRLKQTGHHVECFSPILGAISEQLARDQIPSRRRFSKPTRFFAKWLPHWKYDVIIANHNHIADSLRRVFPRTPMISTVHGIIHRMMEANGKEIRAPGHPAIDADVDQFVSVSEEVRDVLKRDFALDSIVVRNFLDLDHFKPARPASPKPRRILFNSNYNQGTSAEVQIIRQVANHYGADFVAVGLNHGKTSNIKALIEEADVVVGIGRSVLEGVAMGRLGLVHGPHGTGGVICPQNVEKLRTHNFSGRHEKGRLMTPKEIIALTDQHYNTRHLEWGMSYIRQDHNVVQAAERYLQFARGLTRRNTPFIKYPLQ
jgi:glycosyltransferase involved in cell wall biosynthesis